MNEEINIRKICSSKVSICMSGISEYERLEQLYQQDMNDKILLCL